MGDQGEVTIKIVDEDNGKEISIQGGQGTPIGTLVERVYEKLKERFGVQRQPDDRLRCESNGEDVYQFAGLHLRDYLAGGHCAGLVWLFARGTGGA